MGKTRNKNRVMGKGKKTTRQVVREEIGKMSETKKKMSTLQELVKVPFTNSGATGATVGLTVEQLNDIGKGGGSDQRIGNKITITGVGLRGLLHGRGLTIGDNTSQNAVYVRHAILRRKSAESIADFTGDTQLFLNNNSSLSYNAATNVQRYILPLNHKDFDILFQKTEKLGIVNTSQTQNYFNNKKVTFYNRVMFPCEWSDDSSSLDDECNPGIYYIVYVGNINMDDSPFVGDELSLGCAEINMAMNVYYKDL